MQDQKTNSDKLFDILKFDASKKGSSITNDVFQEVVKEITDERMKEAKVKAKEHLLKAMQLREQMERARKDFDALYKKSEKELGKVLNQVESMLSGKPVEEEQQENQS